MKQIDHSSFSRYKDIVNETVGEEWQKAAQNDVCGSSMWAYVHICYITDIPPETCGQKLVEKYPLY